MASIFQINSQLMEAFDVESGEQLISDEELEALFEQKEQKRESLALFVKQLKAEAEAIKVEEDALKHRRQVKENTLERVKYLLASDLHFSDKFETAKVKVSWRKSESVEIADEQAFIEAHKGSVYVKSKTTYDISKAQIKEALKQNHAVEGATLETKNNIQVK